jgi:eukaryotic-like serine/threonine-protein kinase
MERIIDKALEKNLDIRYQHAADLLADFKRLNRQTESARVVTTGASPDEKFKSRKLWVVAGCFAAIIVAAGGAWYMRSGRTSKIDSIAVLPFTNVGGDANTDYLSDGITDH